MITDGLIGHDGDKISGATRHLNAIFLFRTQQCENTCIDSPRDGNLSVSDGKCKQYTL